MTYVLVMINSTHISIEDALKRLMTYDNQSHPSYPVRLTALNELNRPKINLYTFNDLIQTKMN